MLRLISLLLLVYSFFIVRTALPTLPRCIPTHFNAAGVADGWGSPDILWTLLGAQALMCALFLIVPYLGQLSPNLVHFGRRRLSDFAPAQRARALSMMSDMAACLSIVMSVFFVLMLHSFIRAATQPIPRLHPVFPLVLLIGGMVTILVYYFVQFARVATRDPSEPGDGMAP
jgi:uncharacterized membrane protein